MFWCLPRSSKCEWFTLKEFVKHLNIEFGTQYHLVECLDVFDKTKPQPEVLLENGESNCMVIERKAFPWPSDYIRLHQLEHEFMNHFASIVSPAFQDDVYMLGINANHLHDSKKQVRSIAQQIAEAVMERRGQILGAGQIFSKQPVPWRFGHLSNFECDENTPERGVGVMINDPCVEFPDEEKLEETCQAMREKLKELLIKVELKFKNYPDCLRVLLLEIYGCDLLLDLISIDEVVETLNFPLNIDQVWIAEPEWISEEDLQIIYRQIRNQHDH